MEFKDIIGYEGLYKININGDVLNVKRNKVLKWCLGKRGYYRLKLCKNGKSKTHNIHRLIGLHFIPNPNELQSIDHINRIKTDNRIENLRWVSISENMINRSYVINRGGQIETRPYTRKNGSITTTYQVRYHLPNEYGGINRNSKTFKTMEEAEEFRMSIYT